MLIAVSVVLIVANSGKVEGYDEASRLLWESALKFPSPNAIAPLVIAILACGVLLLPIRRTSLKFSLFAVIIALDLGAVARTYNVPTPTADYDSGTPGAVTFLRNDPEPFRVAIFPGTDMIPPAQARPALTISWTMVYGIEDINSCNSLQPRRVVDWLVNTRLCCESVRCQSRGRRTARNTARPPKSLTSSTPARTPLMT